MKNKNLPDQTQTLGFTLLEVMAATVLLALLAVFFYAPQVASDAQRLRRMQAEVTVEEMNRIAYLSQQWVLNRDGQWPGQSSGCTLAITDLASVGLFDLSAAKSPFFRAGLKNFPPDAPLSRGEYGRYYTTCDVQTFSVSLMLDAKNAKWGNYIANLLTGSRLGRHQGGAVVSVVASWPLPGAIPALDAYVRKDAPIFTGAMGSNIDLGEHATFSASDVVLHNGHSLGKTIHYGAQLSPGSTVPDTDCAPGLAPQILTSFNHLLHRSGKSLHLAEATVVRLAGGWIVGSRTVDSDGIIDLNNDNVRINVFIYCS